MRDSAFWRSGEITQPRTHFFGQLCIYPSLSGNDDAQLRQSADMAILLTSTIGRGSDGERPVGGEVDAVAPLRSSGAPFAAGWVEKSREKAFIHEVGLGL